jgi:filamentous hemagglutinin family protein
MITKLPQILWIAALAFVAGRAAAVPPPLPSFDGVNLPSTLPDSVNGGTGLVRKSGGQTTSVTLTKTDKTMDIVSTSKRFVIDWNSFNIDREYRVNFLMPDRASIGINRVTGVGADYQSKISGDLWSNGNVWLLNPNGILFNSTARIDVGGLLAAPAYLRNIEQFIREDGDYDTRFETNGITNSTQPLIQFTMPGTIATGADSDTAVTRPGPVTVDSGAKILTRGGPAMFVVGSAAEGRTLRISGTVTGQSSEFGGELLTYGGLPTVTTAAEEKSSQIVYAASGDY